MKPPQDGRSLRGKNGDNTTVPQTAYNGKIPAAVILRLEREMWGLEFGGVSLIITFRDGHPTFRIEKTVSIMSGV